MTVEIVRRWFEGLPEHEKDIPLILINGKVYTPREVMREVEAGTSLGEQMQEKIEEIQRGSYTYSEMFQIGKERALKWAEKLPEDFSIMAIGKGEVKKEEIIQLIKAGKDIGYSAIEFEMDRAAKLHKGNMR